MKKINIILAFLLFTALNSMSQSVSAPATSNYEVSGKEDSEKYHVALCDYKTDTLTYAQFKDCADINNLTDPQMKITAYTLVCRIGKNDILEHNATGNTLSSNIKERMIAGGVKEFWLEKMIAKKGDTPVEIGTRKFYLTR